MYYEVLQSQLGL